MSLMIDVSTILPIRVFGLVVTHLLSRGVILRQGSEFTLWGHYLKGSKSCLVSRGKLHRMRIDNSGLLLQVERVFFSEEASVINFIHVFFLVLRHRAGRIWVANKPV